MLEKIIFAEPRGFCFGVRRAINIAEKTLQSNPAPKKQVYFLHEIVHNGRVIDSLREKGAIFVENIGAIPAGKEVVFSAHGVSPSVRKHAAKKSLKIVDATCPLVAKVHEKAREYGKKGYNVILIGKKKHQEIKGMLGEAEIYVVSSVDDVNNLKIKHSKNKNKKIACLSQTTLSIDKTKEIIEAIKKKYRAVEVPKEASICYATQKRQDAVKKLAKQADMIFVVGSKKSSNSRSLVEVARNRGVKSYLIQDKSEIKDSYMEGVETLGITAGASTPESLVQDIVGYILKRNA